MSKKKNPSVTFESYYREMYGERWSYLKEALTKESAPVSFNLGLTQNYYLDEASIIAAKSLGVKEGDKVLDLCAAPGGKSLVISSLIGRQGSLVSNDRSTSRRLRMLRVFKEHLSTESLQNIKVKGFDALHCHRVEKEPFDKILVDAPCSSERHVINDSRALDEWSPSRIKRFAKQQVDILMAAIQILKPGGTLVYCTCALNQKENDGVIKKILKRRGKQVGLVQETYALGNATDLGWEILPDQCEGKGPLYFSKLIRLSEPG